MLNLSELIAFGMLGFLLLWPPLWAWRLALVFARHRRRPGAQDAPHAAVILALRGADPSLAHCLDRLLTQDYPRYSVRIVVDSEDDPAWKMVHGILAGKVLPASVDVQVSILENRLETCSLKLSAQLQAVGGLDESTEVVAFIDADVVPAPSWLSSMVAPFSDPSVGGTTGMRWFAPRDTHWGSLVRYLWNAAACTQMYSFRIPWGGSLAFRARVLPHLIEQWSHSFCEDTSAFGVLNQMGLRVEFVPEAIAINQESTDFPNAFAFIRRQLFCARMHHSRWNTLLASNLGTGLALAASTALAIAGLFMGAWHWTAWLGGLIGIYGLGLVSATLVGEHGIRRIVRERGEAAPPFRFSWHYLVLFPVTQVVHFACLFSALRMRRIDWRGITYQFDGPGKLRLLEYRPYRPQGTSSTGSLM